MPIDRGHGIATSSVLADSYDLDALITDTEAAKAAAIAAQAAAETAETNSETAETNSAASAAASAASAASITGAEASCTASKTSAETAETNAAASAASALSLVDSFEDQYLGAKTSDPTLDNDGAALITGALYFNTTDGVMKVWEGSYWTATYATVASALVKTNNLSDLSNASAARTNLGVDAAGTVNYTHPTTHSTSDIADSAITSAKLADDSVTTSKVVSNSITADKLNVTGDGTSGQYLGSDADGSFTWTSISNDPTMGGDLSGTASNAQLGANVVTDTELNSAKLNAIEANATADQTGAEIKTAYEGEANTNAFTNADHTKLDGIDTAANNYALPTADNLTLGGIKVGTNLSIDGSGVLSSTDTNTETTTTLSLAANTLTYVDELGATTNLDLSLYLDDTNLAYIASGALNGATGIATFTRSDASTFTVDLSDLLDDTTVTVNDTLTSTSTTEALSAAQGKVLKGLAEGLETRVALNDAKTGITSSQASAITANTAKVTNVSTNLSTTTTATTNTVVSSDGTNAVLPAATTTVAGVQTGADKLKLDGIEALADVTDAANVDAAGAVMNTDATTASMSFVVDEDTMVSNLATKVPTQQSVKAYVDAQSTPNLNALDDGYSDGYSLGLGTGSLANDDGSANYNIGVGHNSGYSITSGDGNIAIGESSLKFTTTGNSNVATGMYALSTNTVGGTNTGAGFFTLFGNTTGSGNTGYGYQTLHLNTVGQFNVGIGSNAGYSNTVGNNNSAVGKNSLYANTASNNTAVGFESFKANTTGTLNIGLGYGAGDAVTTGSNNTIIGDYAGTTTLADTVVIAAGTTERLKVDSTGLSINGTAFAAGGGIGEFIDTSIAISSDDTALANDDGTNNYNVGIGTSAGGSITTGFGCVAIGKLALPLSVTAHSNTAIGFNSLSRATGTENTGVGSFAGLNITSGTNNIALGRYSLTGASTGITGSYNTGIGYQSGFSLSTGTYNNLKGYRAGYSLTTGSYNVLNGYQAGYSLTTGGTNTYIGQEAGRYATTGSSNIGIGENALKGATSSGVTQSYNIGIGRLAISGLTSGASNVAIGQKAGQQLTTQSNCVMIGKEAGKSETSSNKLHIANNATESLIEGDFAAKTVNINGALTVNGAAVGGGDLVKIATQSFNGSITSMTFTDCFTNTYDTYKVVVTGAEALAGGYGSLSSYLSTDSGATWETDYGYIGTTQTKLRVLGSYDMGSSTNTKQVFADFWIFGTRDSGAYTNLQGFTQRIDTATHIADYGQDIKCNLKSKSVVNSFKIQPNVTLDRGTVTIYGLKG